MNHTWIDDVTNDDEAAFNQESHKEQREGPQELIESGEKFILKIMMMIKSKVIFDFFLVSNLLASIFFSFFFNSK